MKALVDRYKISTTQKLVTTPTEKSLLNYHSFPAVDMLHLSILYVYNYTNVIPTIIFAIARYVRVIFRVA